MDVHSSLEPEGAVVRVNGSRDSFFVHHNIDLAEVRGEFESFDPDAFFSCACISRKMRSADFSRVRAPSGDIPIGWIIPILYFSEPHQFYDTKYLADFAYAGFVQFWRSEVYAGLRKLAANVLPVSDCDFSSVLPEDYAFAVFSREFFKRSKLSLAELQFSLLRQGVWPLNGDVDYSVLQSARRAALQIDEQNNVARDHVKNLKTYRISKSCGDVEHLLTSVISMAHQEFSGLGGFLYLYQVVEHLMEITFSDAVYEASRQRLPAWKLKRKLTDASSETFRLRKIAGRAAENGASVLIFDILGDACRRFIASCDSDAETNSMTWIDSVYRVRNILVHNHLSVMRSGSASQLGEVNALLHRAVLELIFYH